MKRWRSTGFAVMAAVALGAVPLSTARASDDLGSSMGAYCLDATCTTIRFTLNLDGSGWLHALSWKSDDPAFTFDYEQFDQISTDGGSNWIVNSISDNELTLLSGGDFLQAPVSFDLKMTGVTNAQQLINTVAYWGTAREDLDQSGNPYGATYSVEGYVTPEPVTMLLLGTGLAGVAGVARRRRREDELEA